jgi:membrane protein DedA with SNARE-associated domain
MWDEILRAIPVFFFSMIKFIFGPLGGYLAGLNLVTTVLTSVAGMMTAVVLFTYFGEFIRNKVLARFVNKSKNFSEKRRNFVKFWRRYGLVGVAAFTPLVLTPIGGTILAVSFGAPKNRIIFFMFVSAAVWSIIFSAAIYIAGDQVTSILTQYFTLPEGLDKGGL